MKRQIVLAAFAALNAVQFCTTCLGEDSQAKRVFPNFSLAVDADEKAAETYPLAWSPDSLIWKQDLSGYGQSCPLVFRNRIYAVGNRLYLFGKEGETTVVKIGSEYVELSTGNRVWSKDATQAAESSRGRMAGPTLYAGIPIGTGFLMRRGDSLFRVDASSKTQNGDR